MKYEKNVKKHYKSYEFPLDESEISSILKTLPQNDVEGLERIVITPPLKNEDLGRFGRYQTKSNKSGIIYLFAHMKRDEKFIIQLGDKTIKFGLEEFRNLACLTVLHEVGHHVGIKDFQDKSEDFANTYQVKHSSIC